MLQSTLPCDFALPAEWEPQSAIMLTWPHAGTDWKPYLPEITDTYLELADIITRYEQLLVATPDVPATRYQLKKKLSAEQMSRVLLYEVESNDTWVRDHGPLTMVLRRKQNTWMVPYRILDFKFNGWGEKFRWEKDNAITLQLYYQAAFNADIENHQGFVLEGGSIESDGKGTLFTTSQCLLAPHRNQPLDHDRVAPHDTLLYVGCDNPEDKQYEDFQALEKQLKGLFTWEGYPYRLLKLPMPDPIYDEGDCLTTNPESEGDRLPATYANFLILNKAVIYPTYNQPEKDEKARKQIQLAFPDREIIGVDSQTIIRQHGSIHCITMQLPEGALRDSTFHI